MNRRSCLGGLPEALALASLLSVALAAAAPQGYFVDFKQASASRPASVEKTDGDFTMSIHREYKDSIGARLLGIAEATYPPREVLVDFAIEYALEMGSDSAKAPLWWCDGVGVERIPYAVTLSAVEYYARLTENFRRHVFWGVGGSPLLWTDFTYKATIGDTELWSFDVDASGFHVVPFGQGAGHHTEANAVQLWSTVYLALDRRTR